MVVVCPHCQQYFEVDDVYFQQGIPVPCPTCQGALVPYEAPASPPVDPASPAAIPEPAAGAVGLAPDQGLPAPPATEAAGSAPAWSSGDLLWSGSRPPEVPSAPPEVAAPAEPSPPSPSLPEEPLPPAALDGAPAEAPPATPSAPADPQPPAVAADVPAAVDNSPQRPASSWDEVGQLSWGVPPPLAEGTSPAAAFSSPDVIPPQAPAPGAWGPAQSPGAQLPTAPVAAWAEVDPGLPPPPPPAPEPTQEAPVGAVSAPEIIPEAAPVEAWGAAPSMPPAAPMAAEPSAAPAPVPDGGAPMTMQPQAGSSLPGPGGVGTDKDWADAAAAWAASGFAADKMPTFVRQRQSEPPPAPDAPPALLTAADLSPDLPAEPQASAPAAAPQPTVVAPSPPFLAAAPAHPLAVPPPLKPPSKPEIILPSPGAPPPLAGRAASTYVMKGSGEGRNSDAPWTQDTIPPAAGQPQPVRMVLPSIPPVPAPAAAVAPVAPARRGGHPVLWTVLVLLLLGGGAFAGWWFFLGGKERFLSGGGPTIAPDAGAVAPETEPAPPAEEIASAPPDAGAVPDEEKPEVVEPVKPPKTEPPKTEPPKTPPRADVPKPPKPDRPVAAVDRKARAAEAVEFYKKGNEAVKKAQYQEAVKNYQKALELDPTLAVAHRGLGISYAQLRRNQDACREYRLYQKSLPANSKELPALQQILKDCK